MSDYWKEPENIPWSYNDAKAKPPFFERRFARYDLQDYMATEIPWTEYRSKKVLDVGCGSGIDSIEWAFWGARVTATDSSAAALEATRETLQEAHKAMGEQQLDVTVGWAEATSLPFADCSFDLVYSFGVVHHLTRPEKAVSEFARVLRPDGSLILMLYNSDSIMHAYSHGVLGLPVERNGNPYTKTYSIQDIHSLLAPLFPTVKIATRFNVVDTAERRKVRLRPEVLGAGWHHIVTASK